MSEQPDTNLPTVKAWPPLRIALYSIVVVLVLLLVALLITTGVRGRGAPPMPADQVVTAP